MKKTLTLILATVTFSTAQAQQFSGGFRTGASTWMNRQEGKCSGKSIDGQNLTWDKEMFVRYQTKGKFAFEAGMGHYSFNHTREDNSENFAPPEYNVLSVNERSQNLEWNLSAQYDLTCPALQEKCPVFRNLKSYLGVVATPTLSRNTVTTRYVDGVSDGSLKQRTDSKDEWSLWTGLAHTMTYNLCEHMYISSAVRLQVRPDEFFSDASTASRDSRLGLQIGVGYNFR